MAKQTYRQYLKNRVADDFEAIDEKPHELYLKGDTGGPRELKDIIRSALRQEMQAYLHSAYASQSASEDDTDDFDEDEQDTFGPGYTVVEMEAESFEDVLPPGKHAEGGEPAAQEPGQASETKPISEGE